VLGVGQVGVLVAMPVDVEAVIVGVADGRCRVGVVVGADPTVCVGSDGTRVVVAVAVGGALSESSEHPVRNNGVSRKPHTDSRQVKVRKECCAKVSRLKESFRIGVL
jgi:hypothetical protein